MCDGSTLDFLPKRNKNPIFPTICFLPCLILKVSLLAILVSCTNRTNLVVKSIVQLGQIQVYYKQRPPLSFSGHLFFRDINIA